MTSILRRELDRQRSERAQQFEKFKGKLLCQIVRVSGNIKVPNRPGFIWCQEYSPSTDDPPFHVFNAKVGPRVGLPVWVGIGLSGRLEVLDWYNAIIPDMPDYSGEVYLPSHHLDHEWPDKNPAPDAVTVYPRALSMLRTYPGEAGGLTISVSSLRYIHNDARVDFTGINSTSISGSQPASGSALYVGIYLDVATNAIATVDGSTVSDAPTIDPPSPTFPANAIPSALVRLDGDQTSVSEGDIVDFRPVLGEARTGAQDAPIDATYWVTSSDSDLTNEFVVPVNTLGDLLTHDGSTAVKKGVGSDYQVLIADSSQTDGLAWGFDLTSTVAGLGPRTSFVDGVLTTATNIGPAHIMNIAAEIDRVYIHCKTTGSASSTIVDVNLNGTTIFTTQGNRPTLAYDDGDSVAKSGTPEITTVAEFDVLTCDIDQIATGAADLTILIILKPAASEIVAI